jgi:hypothetical protein
MQNPSVRRADHAGEENLSREKKKAENPRKTHEQTE